MQSLRPTPTNRSRSSSKVREVDKCFVKYFYTVKTFVFFLTSFQLVNLLTLTYTDSVLNYIAKRFRIPNTMASFIPSSYMIGSVVSVLPVSYIGSGWHRPRAISVGVVIMVFGLGLCILPHFIISETHITNSSASILCRRSKISILRQFMQKNNLTERKLITRKNVLAKTEYLEDLWNDFIKDYHSPDKFIKTSLSTPVELPCNQNSSFYNPSLLLILGHFLIGSGSSPLWPLGVAYLDDHIPARKMPIYLGIFVGTTLTGPVGGFLLGSVSSAIYVSSNLRKLTPKDPQWIGAWWLGYVIAAALLVLLLVPFCYFPPSLPLSDEKSAEKIQLKLEKDKLDEKEEVRNISELPLIEDNPGTASECSESSSLLRNSPASRITSFFQGAVLATKQILMKPVAVGCIVAYTALANLLAGVTTFGSTYIQREFNVLRITSDMLIGGLCVPLAILGTIGGGYIVKTYNLTLKNIILFNIIMSSIGVVFFISLFPIGCNLPRIAGVPQKYPESNLMNFNATCNFGCNCTKGQIKLVCGNDNITYISPCYAGCTSEYHSKKHSSYKYEKCGCIHTLESKATLGPCKVHGCTIRLVVFMFIGAIAITSLCFCQAPSYSALLRVLADANKPYGIGIMTIISRLLGFIPAPIWFASIIDRSCIYRGEKCNGRSVCKLYDNAGLRNNYVAACVMCGIVYSLVFVFTYCWICWRDPKKDLYNAIEREE